jgi:hypothetical protein
MCNEQVWFNQLTSLEKARRKEEGADPSYNRITILKTERRPARDLRVSGDLVCE